MVGGGEAAVTRRGSAGVGSVYLSGIGNVEGQSPARLSVGKTRAGCRSLRGEGKIAAGVRPCGSERQ